MADGQAPDSLNSNPRPTQRNLHDGGTVVKEQAAGR
jgi:hypothetical protein